MRELIIFLALVMLLISVICIYGARGIVKNRINKEEENRVVLGMKITFCVISILSICVIYCFS